MELAGIVFPLIRVGTEEIPLCLREIRGEGLPPIGIEIRERSRQGRGRQAAPGAQGHHTTPCRLPLHHLLGEIGVHQQVGKVGVPVIGRLDSIQELGPDDAATLPDAGTFAKLHTPVVSLGC